MIGPEGCLCSKQCLSMGCRLVCDWLGIVSIVFTGQVSISKVVLLCSDSFCSDSTVAQAFREHQAVCTMHTHDAIRSTIQTGRQNLSMVRGMQIVWGFEGGDAWHLGV
jgi:hypothetical protein